MTDAVSVRGLVKRFGSNTAVDNLGFDLAIGEVLGFLGPNGAGKSTTMKMICGFLTPTAGTAVVCGHDVLVDPIAVKTSIGYLPEGAPAYPDMTPLGFLDFIAGVRGYSGDDKRARVAEAMAKTHIEDVIHQPIETLSKGFKRRVGLAQALLHDPPVLILDEPNLREIVAFPMNQQAQDLLMGAPAPADPKQLRELHIRTVMPKVEKKED